MSKQDHTATPWVVEHTGMGTPVIVSECRDIVEMSDNYYGDAQANAAYIVQCVNSHAGLVRALEELVGRFERLEQYYFDATGQTPDCENGSLVRARAALAQVSA